MIKKAINIFLNNKKILHIFVFSRGPFRPFLSISLTKMKPQLLLAIWIKK